MDDFASTGIDEQLIARAASLGAVGSPTVLVRRRDAVVIRVGDVVVKAHRADDPLELQRRLEVARTSLSNVFAAPLGNWPGSSPDVVLTAWPAGEPVDPELSDEAPWEHAGRLLALLHDSFPIGADLKPATSVDRVRSAISVLAQSAVSATAEGRGILSAASQLGELEIGAASRRIIHGDFHLGQMARFPGRGWLLLDVDDLGFGDTRWDFARPAAWFAIGLIEGRQWQTLVESYREAGGQAISSWSEIDRFAQAFTVQAAARAVVKADLEQRSLTEAEREFVGACARIADR
ncbi:hypothetical protein [Smaragdicoccus niigatensis]|uniref:hypothetical protein n=1 Tax=Smaragdicoccus niigatensis TaxID=359359 RepID=UPI0003620FCE|nr:hypothetical protein [Smaragdicoccus niigatensis]